jgi:16S rRNA (guanine966-N2)-methyltransferase
MTTTIRIIAGSHRGSKLPVPSYPGLRPTPERLRETLFNWLGPWLVGRRAVDLYAGSGALGIEAASRGAAQVLLVERERVLAENLRSQIERLKLTAVLDVVHADALSALRNGALGPIDLAFVDPPFALDLWGDTLAALESTTLNPGARVYLEFPVDSPPPPRPRWKLLKQTRVGEVGARLIEWSG